MNRQRNDLEELAKLIRFYILTSSSEAGSGHPTSSLSAVELMTALMFGGFFRYDLDNPLHPNNDRLIFSKGHASPLLYSLFAAAGKVKYEQLLEYRKFGSELEGHPTTNFRYTELATGSLGQGLSIGVGMAMNAKYLDKLPYNTFVLLGDSEMTEGSQWEAMQIADFYDLDNLVGVLDVNRLGQSRETIFGYNLSAYEKRIEAFGWQTLTIDGHSLTEIVEAYRDALEIKKPVMIIAKTVKGKGVSFLEDKAGWHGKALADEDLEKAFREIGQIDRALTGTVAKPEDRRPISVIPGTPEYLQYKIGDKIATRRAYGNALVRLYGEHPDIVVLDGEVSNSTYTELFQKAYPKKYFEMFIAEQNMVGVAQGLSRRGKVPFVSTFAAFFTRAFDQIRMGQYSEPFTNVKYAGTHCGVSIGQDGPSQMGLSDIAMFRSLLNCSVIYPADAVSTEKAVAAAATQNGMFYLRLTRMETPVIYDNAETFPIGGSKTLRAGQTDFCTVIAAGITLHESLAAYDELAKEGINIRVIDLYSIQPIDKETLEKAAADTGRLIVVEDHHEVGGIGEAVRSALSENPVPVHSLAVKKIPRSGKPQELLDFEMISSQAIVEKVKSLREGSVKNKKVKKQASRK